MRFFRLLSAVVVFGLAGCDTKPAGEVWPMVEDCDLHQHTCTAQQGEASASLQFTPQPIPIAKPLQVEVMLNQIDATKLELDISGINMYMGYNRVTLLPDNNQSNQFNGQTMLAFCTNEVMHWQITLLAHQTDGTVLQIPFKLETRNR
jgi:hypothetical protein